MIDSKVFDEARRAILDWLSDLMNLAIREHKFEKATEAYRIASKIYGGPKE